LSNLFKKQEFEGPCRGEGGSIASAFCFQNGTTGKEGRGDRWKRDGIPGDWWERGVFRTEQKLRSKIVEGRGVGVTTPLWSWKVKLPLRGVLGKGSIFIGGGG